MSLARIHAEPELVVPALINSLNDPYSSPEKWVILNGLGRFGTNAKPAVPTLVALLNGQYPRSVKSAAALALRSIDPEAAAKAGLK
jgi:HEAT repeat protein